MRNKKLSFGLILFFAIFFGFILNLSDISDINSIRAQQVNAINKNYVIPSGEAVGVKMYTDGLLVVYVGEVIDNNKNVHYPAKNAGIRETDRILSVDGILIETNEQLSDYINQVKRPVSLKVARDEEEFNVNISPVLSNDGQYRIGLWVRDSTAGIGTMTFYNPQNNTFAALGHAICDSDTGAILKVSDGALVGCDILSIKKGKNGVPGELSGQFGSKNLGKIIKNNEFGIFGKTNDISISENQTPMEVATRYQIKTGPAKILCDVSKDGVKSYDVEILSVSKSAELNNKGIVLRVTDEELLSKTGGIVQGMSGSPIIQNNKIVGAVTHVFVNDSTKGYGIFIENMLLETE